MGPWECRAGELHHQPESPPRDRPAKKESSVHGSPCEAVWAAVFCAPSCLLLWVFNIMTSPSLDVHIEALRRAEALAITFLDTYTHKLRVASVEQSAS